MKKTIAAAVVVLIALAGRASAQEAWAGAWTLDGRHEALGAFTGKLEILRGELPSTWDVIETLELGTTKVSRKGVGRMNGEVLEVELTSATGMAGAVGGTAGTELAERRRLTIREERDDKLLVEGFDAQGSSTAAARRGASAVRTENKGKHLLAVAKAKIEEELRDRTYEGLRLGEDFALHRFLHVGVGTHIRPIRPEALTPLQREHTGERQVWILSEVSGGARVPLGASVPVGGATLSVGLDPGARVRWEVTDRYPLPDGIRDGETLVEDLKSLAARTFDLPLDASEALALTPGARRVLEAAGSVAFSGNLTIGTEVANIEGIVRVGASARVGGVWWMQGDVRYELERQRGQGVRLRVTRATREVKEASADLLLGVAVDRAALSARLEPSMSYIDNVAVRGLAADGAASAAEGVAKSLVKFELRGAMGRGGEDEVDLAYRFDLGRDAAKNAYERAVRGDLTAAEAAAAQEGSGVVREYRVLDVETRTYRSADLTLSVILRAGARRTVSWTDLSVEGEVGVARYEIFRFTRERSLELFGQSSRRRRRAMEMDVLRRATPDGSVVRSLRWTLEVEDPGTTRAEADELRRAIAGWGLDARSSIADPESRPFRSLYGKTRSRLTVELAEAGIAACLGASPEGLFDAYVNGFALVEGELPAWATEAGRERLRWAHTSTDDQQLQKEKQQLDRAQSFVKGVRALAATDDPKERAKRLESLAKGAHYDLYAISALLSLCPRDSVRLTGSIQGERISVGSDHTGAAYQPLLVLDPRR